MTRLVLGQVYKSKDASKSDYIQIDKNLKEPVVLKPGQYIQVESKAYKLASIQRALENGKLSEENANKARERAEKMPDFVRGELVLLSD